MSHPSNNSDNQHKGANSGQPAKEPASGRNPKAGEGQFCSAKPTVHWVSDGWTCMSWEGADGQPGGYTVTNGQSAMFFDENGNMTFSTGVPGQAGCGGKLILNTGDQLHKASGSIAIQATGGTSEREGSGRTGTGSASSAPPAYSVFAEGAVAIEAQGDECGIKGDNVIIHAIKTLTLKAGELVNIEVGDGSGKFNVFAGDITFDSEFLNENIDGRKKTKGTGEVVVDQQTKLGATHVINSVGTVTHRIRGNYEVEATGRYRVKAIGNLNFESTTGGMRTKMAGASYTTIFGPKEEKIYGIKGPTAKTAAPETYKLELGPNAMGMTMKSAGGIGITASIGNSFFANKVGTLNLTAGGTMTMKALTIFLN
jgi:hypothetical protein